MARDGRNPWWWLRLFLHHLRYVLRSYHLKVFVRKSAMQSATSYGKKKKGHTDSHVIWEYLRRKPEKLKYTSDLHSVKVCAQNSTARIIVQILDLSSTRNSTRVIFNIYSVVDFYVVNIFFFFSQWTARFPDLEHCKRRHVVQWILTSFVFCGTLAENSSVIDGIVKKNTRTLEYASSESFAHDQRPVHVVIGQRKNRSVVRCVSNHLKQNRREPLT